MSKTILFPIDKTRNASPFVYIKSYRRGGFLRRERIEYTYSRRGSVDDGDVTAALARAKQDYPDMGAYLIDDGMHTHDLSEQTFWVIFEHVTGRYYAGMGKRGLEFTDDIWEAEVIFSRSEALETLAGLRLTRGLRLTADSIILTCINKLTRPLFTITCTSRKSGVTKFFSRQEDGRLRLVETSDAAAHFTYEEVMEEFERLRTSNKHFSYAVMPPFEDNVRAKKIGEYILTHKVRRGFVSAMKLKNMC